MREFKLEINLLEYEGRTRQIYEITNFLIWLQRICWAFIFPCSFAPAAASSFFPKNGAKLSVNKIFSQFWGFFRKKLFFFGTTCQGRPSFIQFGYSQLCSAGKKSFSKSADWTADWAKSASNLSWLRQRKWPSKLLNFALISKKGRCCVIETFSVSAFLVWN